MDLTQIVFIIVVIVIAITAAFLFLRKYADKAKQVTGGSTPKSPIDIATAVYEKIKPHIQEVGTPKHIVRYLSNVLDVNHIELSDFVRNRHDVEHKDVLELLIIASERTKAASVEELILIMDLRYCWFLSAEAGTILMFNRSSEPITPTDITLVQSVIDVNATKSAHIVLESERTRILDKLKPIMHLYRKFVGKVTTGPKLRKQELTIDAVGISGIVAALIDLSVKASPATPKTISEKLSDVDLIAMYPREPYVVKAFIDRIKKEIDILSGNYYRTVVPLSKNLLRDEVLNVLQDIPRWDLPRPEQRPPPNYDSEAQRYDVPSAPPTPVAMPTAPPAPVANESRDSAINMV